MASVDQARQQVGYDLIFDGAAYALRKTRLGFEEALQVALRLKPPGREAFQSLRDDRGNRLDPNQRIGLPALFLEAVADRCGEGPEAIQQAAAHSALGLERVMFPMVLGHRYQYPFHEVGSRVVAERHARAFQDAARVAQFIAQRPVRPVPTRESANVVDDHNSPLVAMLAQVSDQLCHRGSAAGFAGQHLVEHLVHNEALAMRVFAIGCFLRTVAVALGLLGLRGHPAVDDGLGRAGLLPRS